MKVDRIKIKTLSVETKQDYVEYEEEPGIQYWDEFNALSCILEVNGKEFKGHNLELPFFLLDDNKAGLEWAWGLKDRDESGATQKDKVFYRKVDQGLISNDYLDSCSCGHAGCNGIWSGVVIKRKKHHFIYTAPENMGYRSGILGTGKLQLKVPVEDILEIRKQLKEIAHQVDPKESVASVIYNIHGDSYTPTRSWVVNTNKEGNK